MTMAKKVSRRTFIQKSVDLGAASLLGGLAASGAGCAGTEEKPVVEPVDIAAVKGTNRFEITRRAVELMGGMERYVPRESKVCILANAQKNNPGTFTHPEVLRAVIRMCRQAGAMEVNCLSWIPRDRWISTGLGKVVDEEGARLKIVDMKDETRFRSVEVPAGKKLFEARIMETFYEHDVFINMPICKDHVGNRFTGTMKNLMGLNSPKSNRTFHTGNFKNDNIEHLDQCIADLNTVIRCDLCVVDATEFIITNGPFGPGELNRPRKVVAGTDRVAVDAYCATLWGLKPEEIIMIDRGHKHGLGEIDFKKLRVTETV